MLGENVTYRMSRVTFFTYETEYNVLTDVDLAQ